MLYNRIETAVRTQLAVTATITRLLPKPRFGLGRMPCTRRLERPNLLSVQALAP